MENKNVQLQEAGDADIPYIRIGTSYYKKVRKPLSSGDTAAVLILWAIECIRQDHGKDFLSRIPKYDGFCLVPSHLHYQKAVMNFYNKYHPFAHQPQAGNFDKTLTFLRHIFGQQLELGLDYLKILLLYPMQTLPILCLVSSERETGKTTFLNFLKAIFGENMTINSNEDFRSNFNAEWATKLIIGVDETFLERRDISERLKSLSISKYSKVEAKGVDREEIEFFGKFILCSNNEDNFIFIDRDETRYWVLRVPQLSCNNTSLLNELKMEIPFFIQHLIDRSFHTQKQTRMWFTPQQIATPALSKLKRNYRNRLENELAQILLFLLDTREPEVQQISFCVLDAQDWLKNKGIKGYDALSVKKLLQQIWQLRPASNSNSYLQYRIGLDDNVYDTKPLSRYYE